MGGGLMQLVAYGAQDVYLTGNPQITFFKVVYRRHTNFSMEAIEQTINGSSQAGPAASTTSGTVTISRNGDLVHKIYVTSDTASIENGSELVNQVDLEIGGQLIDRHKVEWMQVWNELSTPESKALGLKAMQGNVGSSGGTGVGVVQVPLLFWFCRNPGLALPLIALQYHEVKLKFTFGTGNNIGENDAAVKVLCDYIYLDTDERRRFAQVSHEYLIEQVQEQALNTTQLRQKLNFNHPVKELIWTSPAANVYQTAKLTLNGHDRFSAQQEEYFQVRQPFDYHTAVPKQNLPGAAQTSLLDRQITLSTPAGGNAAGYQIEGAAGDVTATQSDFDFTNNVITLSAAGALDAATFPQGTQLAIVLLTSGDAADITCTPAEAVGDTFFCTVTSDATGGANVLTIPVTPPTTAHSTAKIITATNDADSNSTVAVFIVTNGNSAQARTSQLTSKINVYSFGLKPEEHQPSGTCNFSRIDTAHLEFGGAPGAGNIYAVNYNVLRIMSGMGGLAYSN